MKNVAKYISVQKGLKNLKSFLVKRYLSSNLGLKFQASGKCDRPGPKCEWRMEVWWWCGGGWMEQISQLKRRKKLGKIQSGGRHRKAEWQVRGERGKEVWGGGVLWMGVLGAGPNGYPIPDPNPKFFSIPDLYPIFFQNHRVFRVLGISENYVFDLENCIKELQDID